MDLAILTDFDGTVASRDASFAVLDRFGENRWKEIEERAVKGEMTIPEALRIQSKLIRATRDQIRDHIIETIEIREGFPQFANFCRDHDIHLEICSDGFGLTIEILLDHWDLNWIPWSSNRLIPSPEGSAIEFPYARDNCPVNANCKCSHLERLEKKYNHVIFIGDGTTDVCVAGKAEEVFARDQLEEIMKASGMKFIHWDSWSGILEHVKDIISA